VPPMIMAFPALISLHCRLNDRDNRLLKMLCETLSAPHPPRLEELHLQLSSLNVKTAAMLAPVFQRLSGSLTSVAVNQWIEFDGAQRSARAPPRDAVPLTLHTQ
jgi:hypothetical protein